MAAVGKWEVVGKGGKKRAPGEWKKAKAKSSDIPKADDTNPLGDTTTMYQALKTKVIKPENGHVPMNHLDEEVDNMEKIKQEPSKKLISGKKKGATPKLPKPEQDLLEEALQEVDLDDLKAMLTNLESTFPNNPSIWLKDLSSFIQLKLSKVPEKDPVFEDKPRDYPMCLVSEPVKTFLLSVVKKTSTTTQELFYMHCINNLASELRNGQSAYGDQIMIQITVQCSPAIMVSRMKEYEEMINACKTRPREALALMWSVGQLPNHDLAQGLRVWLQVMMPLLSVRQLAKFSVTYLEYILNTCSAPGGDIQPEQFLAFLDVTFSTNSPLANNQSLQRTLLRLYPKIKPAGFDLQCSHALVYPGPYFTPSRYISTLIDEKKRARKDLWAREALSLTVDPQKTGRLYFASLLKLLNGDLPSGYQTEVLNCLILCLEKDPQCFKEWTDLYPENLEQSSLLLSHLGETSGSASRKVSNHFSQAMQTFQVFNSEMKQKERSKAGLDECVKACNALEEKKKKCSCFSLKKLFKLLILILVGFITYDVYKHKGYEGSKTHRFLKEYGIEEAAIQAGGSAKEMLGNANSWIQQKYPTYHAKVKEYMEPVVEFTWEKLVIAGNFVAEQTKPAREYLNKKIPELLEKIEKEAPVYLGIVQDYLKHIYEDWWPVARKHLVTAWDYLSENVPIILSKIKETFHLVLNKIYELAPDFFSAVAAWFEKLGERIAEKLPDVIAVIQEYAVIACNLAMNLVNSLVEWLQNLAGSSESMDELHQTQPPVAQPVNTAPK